MNLRNRALLILGCALLLAPLASFADPLPPPAEPVAVQDFGPRYEPTYPQYTPQQPGHYELRAVSQWIPGSVQQVFVPGSCWGRRRWWRRICGPAQYERRWTPGHYQTVRQWIWVANAAPVAPPPDQDGDYDYDD